MGLSTYGDTGKLFGTLPLKDNLQRLFISDAVYLSVRHGLMGVLIWNLFDHPEAGGPKRPAAENYFGILSKDGVSKPAAKMIESGFYPNSCGQMESEKDLSGFCIGASGVDSQIKLQFSYGGKFSIGDSRYSLDRGIHCFCSDPFLSRLMKLVGFSIKVQHRGITSINGKIITDCP